MQFIQKFSRYEDIKKELSQLQNDYVDKGLGSSWRSRTPKRTKEVKRKPLFETPHIPKINIFRPQKSSISRYKSKLSTQSTKKSNFCIDEFLNSSL